MAVHMTIGKTRKHFAIAFIDDIAINPEVHVQHLQQVLEAIERAGLKTSNCQVGMKEVIYLGHKMGGGKIANGKLKAIKDCPIPETKRQILSFLSHCQLLQKIYMQPWENSSLIT